MASALKWLLNELSEVRQLVDSAKSAEKARVDSIKAEAGRRFQKCYDHFCYMNTAVHTQKRRYHDHPELVVSICEVAFMTGFSEIAREVVQSYFDEKPQKDQFYCRAKILFGLIIDFEAKKTNGLASIKERKSALVHVIEALDVATNTELNGSRYSFLIFNASLACWQIVSPFLRATRASNFLLEMSRCSAALEKVDDVDKSWRIKFLSAAAFCYEDDKKLKESSDLLDKAISIAESMLMGTTNVEKNVSDDVKKCSAESDKIISAIRAVEDREEMLNKPPKIDPDKPEGEQEEKLPELPALEGLASQGYDALKEQLNQSSKVKAAAEEKLKAISAVRAKEEDVICRLYMQRVNSNPADAKKVQSLSLVMQSLRIKTLVNMQCIMCGAIPEKDVEATFASMNKELFEANQSSTVVETILDVSRIAWKLNNDKLAVACIEKAELTSAVSPAIRVKLDLCKSLRIVSDSMKQSANKEIGQRLTDKQIEGFNVSRRIEAIKILERTLTMATSRLDDNALVEDICVAIWNTGLPMLTPHLRSNVYSAFSLAAEALSSVSSALTTLRASLHFEISKCEEQTDFVAKAKQEGDKAILCDYGTLDPALVSGDTGLDRNRGLDHLIKPFVEVLNLRVNVYGSPEDVESQVLLNLQQIKESNSKSFQADMLIKGAKLMFDLLLHERSITGPPGVDLTIGEIESCIMINRTTNFAVFTEAIQRRSIIMANLAQIAHSQRNVRILQRCAQYVLSQVWNPADKFMKHIIDRQIDMHFILADSLVERLASLWIDSEQEKALELDEEALEDGAPSIPNPRTLGIKSKYCTVEMNECKRLIVLCLSKGIELSSKTSDEFGVQNGIIYFWNLHFATFRHELYKQITDEVYNFLKASIAMIESLPQTPSSIGRPTQIDSRLKISIINSLALLHEARGELLQGAELANRGAADARGSVYNRRKLCETGSRLSTTASASGGGKGGKASEPPKFDHPILNVYALLAQAELPLSILSKEQVTQNIDKAVDIMKTDLGNLLRAQDWEGMSQEAYDEIMEMQAECWTRLARVKIVLGDIHSAQDLAERCMALVAEDSMKKVDEKKLSPRVWRWMSLCERYFGMAIQQIIDPVGMDESLLNELGLACLRHLCISCSYALRAAKEDLLVSAAISAWNSSAHMVNVAVVRPTLLLLQRDILNALLTCKDSNEDALILRQQFYLAMIEEQALSRNYEEASELVFEAFDKVPSKLQKPLWKWRVVVLSKKGKNVLDAIQKLKEGDASLQARVYAILARASSNPKQQIEAYKKTIEILKENMERVDYTLETAQWMASAGVPRVEIVEVVQSAVDCLYEVEEKKLIGGDGHDGGPEDDRSEASSRSGASSRKSASRSASGRRTAPSPGSKSASRAGTKGSKRGGSKTASLKEEDVEVAVPSELSIKHFEQGVRSLTMLAMLCSDELQRQERCIEAVYFVEQFFALWATSMKHSAKCNAYFKLTPVERDATSFDTFVAPESAYSDVSIPVDDPVALLCWMPSEAFKNLMVIAEDQVPKGIPNKTMLSNLPLTLHYANWLLKTLDHLGFPKHALFILGWIRAIFCAIPDAEKRECVFGMIHYKSIAVMMKCGLGDLVSNLPAKLGNTNMDFSAFLSTFGSKLIDPATIAKREVMASEELSVFGFSSWTRALSGIDEGLCGLEICHVLLAMGQVAQCSALAGIIHRDFMVKQDVHSLLQVTTILAELNLVTGKPTEVLKLVLTARSDMREAGDATILAKHVQLAVSSYVLLGQLDEAKRLARDAIATLTTFANLSMPKDHGQGDANGIASRSVSSIGSRQGIKSGGTSKISSISQFESSLEVVESLAAVSTHYVNVLAAEAIEEAYNGGDPRSQYVEIGRSLDGVHDLAVAVCGRASSIVATILEVKSRALLSILLKMNKYVALPSNSTEEYRDWFLKNYMTEMRSMEVAVDIRRGLMSRISLDQLSYVPTVAPKKVVEEVTDPKAKKGKAPEPIIETAVLTETRMLSLALNRATAFAELQLAEHYMIYGRLCGDHLTVVPLEPDTEPTVIEKFLKDTTQPIPFKKDDFKVSHIIKGSHLASSAAQLLDHTDFETFGALLHANSGLMRLCGGGAFDATWRKQKSDVQMATDGKGEVKTSENAFVLDPNAAELRTQLAAQVPVAIAARRFNQAFLACATLVDSFGSVGQGSLNSVCWIFVMQSIMARDWLLQNWVGTLNPNGDIAASVRRLDQLENAKHPSKESQPQIGVELRFLQNTSPAWNRLDISADPANILSKVPSSTALLCIQMCPTQSCLYVCAGIPQSLSGTPYTASGSWKVAKLVLNEADRRLLLTLVKQQRKWREDAGKFVAVFGENVSAKQDLVGFEATFGSKLMKSERALEERLRALISDMEQVLFPIFGEGAEFREFLKSLSPNDASLSLMTIIDSSLQELPWEGLSVCSLFGGQVCRDFSLHMFGHRLASFDSRVCDASGFKTVFDPFGDDVGSKLEGFERESIRDNIKQLVADGAAGATKWMGVNRGKGQLTLQDWVSSVQTSDAKKSLFIYAPGRLGSLLSPIDAATMDFRKVLLLMCVDQGHNDASFRRQNSLDNTKTLRDISSENPLKISANVSLAGSGSIVIQAWATTLSSQKRLVSRFWAAFSKAKKNSIISLANASGLGLLANDDPLKNAGVKPWIYLSRLSFGLSVTYNDNV